MTSSKKASIGNRIFEDLDGDGIQDTGEAGLQNVTVKLLDSSGRTISTQVTGANGAYSFTGVTPGHYKIKVEAPSGYAVTTQNAGSDDAKDSDADATGLTGLYNLSAGKNETTADIGLYRAATIGDRVFADANANGIQDSGEGGVSGVTIKLLKADGSVAAQTATDGNGAYTFANLKPGAYSVLFVAPNGSLFSRADQGGNDALDSDANVSTGQTGQVTVVSNGSNLTLDAGLYQKASLGDRVWEDKDADGIQEAGEGGISGATVRLLAPTGNTVIATTTTDANGHYSFAGQMPGDYRVEVVKPAGYEATTANVGANDALDSDGDAAGPTAAINRTSSETDTSSGDFGFYKLGSIGDFVWDDADRDGVQDAGEQGLSGVGVMLLDGNGAVVATTTSGPNGAYGFANVAPGTYAVQFAAPSGYVFSAANQGNDGADSDADAATGRTNTFVVTSGDAKIDIDAGLNQPPPPPAKASIGAAVWVDADRDGIRDAGEAGLANVAVKLLDENQNVVATTRTDADGTYLFTNVDAGDYRVQFFAPSGYVLTQRDAGADDAADSDAHAGTGITGIYTLDPGENETSVDAGLYRPTPVEPPDGDTYDDLIEGGDGDDQIHGGRGNDEMQGEGGNDLVDGGADNGRAVLSHGKRSIEIGDNLYGNDGRDTFLYRDGDGVDMIWDFQPGLDVIDATVFTLDDIEVTHVGALTNRIPTGSHDKLAILFRDGEGAIVFNDLPNPSSTAPAIRLANGQTLSAAQLVALAQANAVAAGAPLDLTASNPATSTRTGVDKAGSNESDWLVGTAGNDRLYGNEGINLLEGLAGDDNLYGGNSHDGLFGDAGNDNLYGNGGDDLLVGGAGNDKLYGTAGVDIIWGDEEEGGFSFSGGAGDNRYRVDNASDSIIEGKNGGADVAEVSVKAFALDANSEVETIRSTIRSSAVDVLLVGSNTDNAITGHSGRDTLRGQGGDDKVVGGLGSDVLDGGSGDDRLDAGGGKDVLTGGLGRDVLVGGSEADVFDFNTIRDSVIGSGSDVVYFSRVDRDKLDLSGIDAREDQGGDQAFAWIGDRDFSNVAGEVRYVGSAGLLSGDTDGDGRADFQIKIVGQFSASDVIL